MVLRLKAWESRSPPGLRGGPAGHEPTPRTDPTNPGPPPAAPGPNPSPPNPTAGWSSPVARQAHNLKVPGSNPGPATTNRRLPGTSVPGSSRLQPPSHTARISRQPQSAKESGHYHFGAKDERADVATLMPALRGGRRGGPVGSAAGQAVAQGCSRDEQRDQGFTSAPSPPIRPVGLKRDRRGFPWWPQLL